MTDDEQSTQSEGESVVMQFQNLRQEQTVDRLPELEQESLFERIQYHKLNITLGVAFLLLGMGLSFVAWWMGGLVAAIGFLVGLLRPQVVLHSEWRKVK
ncbi:MAG: hypothetical protein ACREK5_04870 [Gemmatimonadota bacterium]